jgi:NCAIR mutase (PurE)-related protein
LDDLGENSFIFDYNRRAQILIIRQEITKTDPIAKIGIITAGTSDINIAEEARVIVEQGGCEAITSYDIGVAGIHRLFPKISHMVEEEVNVIVVCAGMEGALPSVVAGLVDIPVIGVPTSVGYGIGADGKAAVYSMLQSCAPGLSVVNIDNGFGAAIDALTIVQTIARNVEKAKNE